MLFVFPSRADFEAEAFSWRIRHDNGTRWIELTEDELRQREPGLAPALHVRRPGRGKRPMPDPGAYVAALVLHAAGARRGLLRPARTGFHRGRPAARGPHRRAGEFACDKAVIAAGAWSKDLPRRPVIVFWKPNADIMR